LDIEHNAGSTMRSQYYCDSATDQSLYVSSYQTIDWDWDWILINQAAVYWTIQMLRSIWLTNQKIEFYKLTNQKMLWSICSAK